MSVVDRDSTPLPPVFAASDGGKKKLQKMMLGHHHRGDALRRCTPWARVLARSVWGFEYSPPNYTGKRPQTRKKG